MQNEMLTGKELDKAVVRVKWPNAAARHWGTWRDGESGVCIGTGDPDMHDALGAGERDSEAWENAADKAIEAAGYTTPEDPSGLWYWTKRTFSEGWYSTRALALESAKRDYVQRAQARLQAVSAGEQSDEEWVRNHFGFAAATTAWHNGSAFVVSIYHDHSGNRDGLGESSNSPDDARRRAWADARRRLESMAPQTAPQDSKPTLEAVAAQMAEAAQSVFVHLPQRGDAAALLRYGKLSAALAAYKEVTNG